MSALSSDSSAEARGFLLSNPDAFILYYFNHRIDKLEDFHLRLIRTATQEKRGLILYPATHGKTTIVSELLPIWAICKDPNIRIVDIAKNDTDAKSITRSIQSELLSNERLIRDFGPFKPEGDDKAWSLERFDVAKRVRHGKSSTWAAFGAGARTALGYRTDWTICDDVVTDVNSNTPEQRQKLREWFNQGPETMGDSGDARLTVVGTVFHPEDLYHDLKEMVLPDSGESIWYVQTEYAILNADKKEVLWPERRPWIWLMQRKAAMGTLDFNKRFNNVAVDPSRMVFKEEYVRGGYIGKSRYPGCLDREFCVGDVYDPTWRRYAGFDPAVGKISSSSKFCAHIELAVGRCAEHERCLWIVDIHRDQMTLPQQVDLIIQKHEEYENTASIIEANAYQMGLYQAVKQKLDEQGMALNVQPHYTSRTNKPDPETGVQAMAPWFEDGKVHIPWGNASSQRRMAILVDELIQFPGRTTDTVMAFWFAWRHAMEMAPRFQSHHYIKKPLFSRQNRGRYLKNPYYTRDHDLS